MMRFLTWLPVCLLMMPAPGCKRPDPIHLQPTIEEPAAFSSIVKISDGSKSGQLMRGFYELQSDSWRWAAPQFSVALATPPGAARNGAWVFLDFTLPEPLIAALKQVTVAGKVGDTPLTPETFSTVGDHVYRREAPAPAFNKDVMSVSFTVDKSMRPPNDERVLSLVVTRVGLEAK